MEAPLPSRFATLKLRLGLGAALIGAFAVLASALTIFGLAQMSQRIDTVLLAEQRMQRYAGLANQVGSFLVVSFEANQAGLAADVQDSRLDGLVQGIRRSFTQIRADLSRAVDEAESAGVDEQSRRATRSIGIARMEALFNATLARVQKGASQQDPALLRGQLTTFSIAFDPLLNAAIVEERRVRDQAIREAEELRARLSRWAIALCLAASLLFLAYYLGLVRPQMRRLSLLRAASKEIAAGDFQVTLPVDRPDEIGSLFEATNAMARALAERKAQVARDRAQLSELVADRTRDLQHANEALAKTDEDRRRFFADISHELRTPLTVILMETELALKAGQGPRQTFETIQGRAQRLNRRIDDLLRIARSETGKLSLEETGFDLAAAARAAVADIQGQIDSAGIVLALKAQTPAPVRGDPNWVRQVITGLIENAIRHAASGKHLVVAVERVGPGASIRVIDNGPGIAEAELGIVLQRFAQGRGPAKGDGFGIGLSLARWIVERQGGQLTLVSPVPEARRIGPGVGTMVTVLLPGDPV